MDYVCSHSPGRIHAVLPGRKRQMREFLPVQALRELHRTTDSFFAIFHFSFGNINQYYSGCILAADEGVYI